ncbi:MAG: xylulokinase [Pseudomonadota bacterium]
MYLGIDLGTSGLRAVLVDDSSTVIGSADTHYGVDHPHPGWSEQDPADWITACREAVAALRSAHGAAFTAVRAIGLSGHMHGATLLDGSDTVLRPCILWNDTRSAAEAAALDAVAGVRDRSGNIVFPGFTAPKLRWVENHERDVFDRVATVLLPKDYLRLWLTGEAVSDCSDSAGTSWLDVGARDWSDALLDAGHMRADQMPRLVEGAAVSGELRAELLGEWGLSGPVRVAGGGGDNAAAAVGAGCAREGDGFVSLGTSGVLLAARAGYAPAPESAVHTFCHALPDTWYQMGVMLAATDCLNWLARLLGRAPADLAAEVEQPITGPSDTVFLPYLSGERTPHNDSAARGAFAGLAIADDPADLTRAVMQGVAMGLRDSLDALHSTGATPSRLLAIGGGARSRFWLETLATVLGVPLDVPEGGEFGAALGAARLAMLCDNTRAVDAVLTSPPLAYTVEPRAELLEDYAAAHARFKAVYPALKSALA